MRGFFRRRRQEPDPVPDPPVNVHLVLPDDTTCPLDCVYVGKNRDGIHNWQVLAPAGPMPEFTRIGIDALPGRTGLLFDEQLLAAMREKG